jgi:hypothetical protein
MKNTARDYKMRAECEGDAELIQAQLAPWLSHWDLKHLTFTKSDGVSLRLPDVEIEFGINADGPSKGEMKWLIDSLTDCHVAAESLDGAAEYTGQRHPIEESDCIVVPPSQQHIESVLENLGRYVEYLEAQHERVREAKECIRASLSWTGQTDFDNRWRSFVHMPTEA